METKRDMFQTQTKRRTSLIWPAAILLAAAAGAAVWLTMPLTMLTKKDAAAPPIYAARENGSSPMDAVTARLKTVEARLTAWTSEHSGLAGRMSQIEKTLTAGVRRARAETTALVEGLKREMNRSFEAVNSRLGGLESVQRETHDQVARLEADLTAVRGELATVREANAEQASRLRQIEEARSSTQNEVSQLQNKIRSNEEKTDALSHQVDRENVGFEVSKDRTQEVVSGIYLTIKSTDVGRQQVDGWVQIAGDGRFVWLRGISAQNPVSFSSRSDERPYHLVFTRVTDDTAAGYVLVPSGQAKLQSASR